MVRPTVGRDFTVRFAREAVLVFERLWVTALDGLNALDEPSEGANCMPLAMLPSFGGRRSRTVDLRNELWRSDADDWEDGKVGLGLAKSWSIVDASFSSRLMPWSEEKVMLVAGFWWKSGSSLR